MAVCLTPGCPTLVSSGYCRSCARTSTRNHRGVPRQARGYDADWARVRRAVLIRDGYVCRIRGPRCKGRASTVDHIVPLSRSGARLNIANLQAACWSCNYGKRDRVVRPTGSRVVWVVGAPATGKSYLRSALSSKLGLPSFGIDDERLRLLKPGEDWPEDDSVAWQRLRASALRRSPCIIETTGLATERDAYLFDGVETFTVRCEASYIDRHDRLSDRVRRGERLTGIADYVETLLRAPEPAVRADAVWSGGDPTVLADSISAWLGQPQAVAS